jgi:hypothetical protein
VQARGWLRRIWAAGPLEEGVAATTTTGQGEAVDKGTEGAAVGAIVGEAVGVVAAVGVVERG